ncbi:MAG: LPS export ABC transporter permease LptG [Gammaproteobacteria bacterium]|nr:LPS export ABC transporter permease LptG [Gammaproteobacteria bacterium]
MFGILDRYIVRSVLTGVGMVVLVLLSLGGLLLLIGQQDDIGVGNYDAFVAVQFVALNLPQQAWELLPISALIGSLIGLGNLARDSEIIVLRTSGLSVWHLARSVALSGLILATLGLLIGEGFGPPLEQFARHQKVFAKFNDISVIGSGDAWVRDGNLLVNVERQTGKSQFGGMMLYEVDNLGRLRAMGRAVSAREGEDGAWSLEQYDETRFAGDTLSSARVPRRVLKSDVTAEFLGIAAASPARLPTLALWAMARHLDDNGLDSKEIRFALWSRIARSVAPIFAVLLALPFVFGSLRASGTGAKVAVGLILGIAFFFLQRLLESGAVVFSGNPAFFAWLPTALMAAVALVLIQKTR